MKTRRFFKIIASCALLPAGLTLSPLAAQTAPAAKPVSAPASPATVTPPAPKPTLVENVIYGHAGGVDLKLDMIIPVSSSEPAPVMVYFHGGGWQAGSKRDGRNWCGFFANQGYLGVSVGYRFRPEFPWPAQVEDAKASIRYLRAHAKELNIDPNRIVAMGDSAGGYLALMLGVTGPEDGLEGDGGNPGVSSRVQAVVSYYGGGDFTNMKPWPADPELDALMMAYYKKTTAEVVDIMFPNKDPKDPIYTKMSVRTYVSKGDAPVLLFQGDADKIVNPEQAYKLDQVLTAAQVPHELVIVKGGGHGFTREQYAQTAIQTMVFLGKYLKANP